MFALLKDARRALTLSTLTVLGGVIMLVIGSVVAYGVEESRLSIANLLMAHLLTLLGPTAIKLGYVLRLHALRRLGASSA